jgi:solute carrier family 25 folate transporter 32
MLDAFAKVVKHEGPMGLYRGIVPSLLLTSHGALQFMAYEEIKKLIRKYNGGEEHLQTWQTLFASSSSKVFASCVTYPSQVVRARLQQMDPNHAASLRDTPTTDLASRQRYYRGTVDVVIKVTTRLAAPLFLSPRYHSIRFRSYVLTRLQLTRAVECAVQVVRLEGLLGFYKGLVPNLLRVVPSSTITFVVYEWVAKMLGAKT